MPLGDIAHYWWTGRSINLTEVAHLRAAARVTDSSPRDWKLYETNSWVNYFQKHDHSAKGLDIQAWESKSVCDT